MDYLVYDKDILLEMLVEKYRTFLIRYAFALCQWEVTVSNYLFIRHEFVYVLKYWSVTFIGVYWGKLRITSIICI